MSISKLKSKISAFLLILTFSSAALAENRQFVIPQKIFVGDTVEIKYLFHSDASIFPSDLAKNSRLELSKDFKFFEEKKDSFSVKSIFIERNSSEYVLSLTIVPWRQGILAIEPFDLTSLILHSLNKTQGGVSYTVKLDSIEVHSLLKQKNITSFMPQSGPLLLPGTTVLLAVFSFVLVVLLSLLVYFASKLPMFAKFIEKILYILSLKHNSRTAINEIRRLQKKSDQIVEDKVYARELQRILRRFLRERFSHDFQSVTTGKLYEEFIEVAGGSLSDFQSDLIEKLTSIFLRTDYIRFANEAHFEDGERLNLTKEAIQLIIDFEADEKSHEEEKK